MPPQTTEVSAETYRARIAKLQDAMKEFGLRAVVLEPGPAMMYLTGVRWGRSERTFAVVFTLTGDPAWVLPGFEEMRARELIKVGDDIRAWQEDESPYQRIHDITPGRPIPTCFTQCRHEHRIPKGISIRPALRCQQCQCGT